MAALRHFHTFAEGMPLTERVLNPCMEKVDLHLPETPMSPQYLYHRSVFFIGMVAEKQQDETRRIKAAKALL